MIREKDMPYIRAIKKLEGGNITSNQIEDAVYAVNQETGMYYDGQGVITLMQYYEILDIQSHLGQPRQGPAINGGRLHTLVVYWGE